MHQSNGHILFFLLYLLFSDTEKSIFTMINAKYTEHCLLLINICINQQHLL